MKHRKITKDHNSIGSIFSYTLSAAAEKSPKLNPFAAYVSSFGVLTAGAAVVQYGRKAGNDENKLRKIN